MRIFLLLILAWYLSAEERWFAGTLAGQPLASLHQIERGLPDGGLETTTTMLLAIRRALPGQPEFRLQVSDQQTFTENRDGLLTEFRFDHDENGTVSSAVGRVVDGVVVGTLSRLGRTTSIHLPVPQGMQLLGDQASQRRMVARAQPVGAITTLSSLAFISNQVQIVTSTATSRGAQSNQLMFEVVVDAMPLPMQLQLAPDGALQGMAMNFGVMALELKPAAGPVALLGAELPPTGLVQALGPAPRPGLPNRFRLPAGEPLPLNPFQAESHGVVTVSADAAPMNIPHGDEYLGASPQLELDDPALRAWVMTNQDGKIPDAERLRIAVRSHITHKDMSKGDASALETFRSQQGDCTEHATLLCAALRIARIPARIEVGLVYAPDYHGWVGHAWNSAWVDGKWIHLDSAYPGISRSCYVALGYSEGGQTGAAMLIQLNRLLGKPLEVLAEQ